MDKQEKVQGLNIVMNGITINGPMFDIHDNGVVENHYHINSEAKSPSLTISDTKIKEALEELLSSTDENGHKLFAQKNQWYAVFRVLSESCDYPANIKDFCRVMTDMGMDEVMPPCKYDSIKKVPSEVTQLACKTTLWQSYRNKATTQAKKQIEVALKLMDLLSEKG